MCYSQCNLEKMVAIVAAIACVALSNSSYAAVTDWLVYSDAGASARSDDIAGQSVTQCSGTLASTSYCGADAIVSSDRTSLISSASADEGPSPNSNSGALPAHGDGWSSASLATGELKLSAHATGYGGENTFGGARASFQDTLDFDLTGIASPVAVTVNLRVDGTSGGFEQPRFAFGMSDSISSLNTGIVGWGPGSTADPATFIDFGGGTGRSGDWSVYGPNRFVGTFLVDPAHPVVYIAMDLSAGGSTEYSDTFANFGHTAALDFILPKTVSYTSASGAFLTSTPSAVPESATWTMMIVGFGLAGGAIRMRPRATALAIGRF